MFPFYKPCLRDCKTQRPKRSHRGLSVTITWCLPKTIKVLEQISSSILLNRFKQGMHFSDHMFSDSSLVLTNCLSVFVQLYLTIILPDTQKLLRPIDRKTAVISLAKTLTDSRAFAEKYKKGWGYTCEALLKLLENPPILAATEDIIVEQDPDDMSFGVGFTQLTTIRKQARDHWPEVTDVKMWVSDYLKTANAKQKRKITSYAQERLSAEAASALAVYMR